MFDSPELHSPAARRLAQLRDFAVAALLAWAVYFNYQALRSYVFEDAYITFRYAANLAAGEGFVFQPGERVLGTSTPLYALVLGLLGALGIDIPTAGGLLFVVSLSACGAFGWLILRRRGAPDAGALFAAAAVSGAGGVLAYFGMELALHLALILLAAWLAAEDRPCATGVVLGLVCLNRYDGVMVAAAVLLTLLLRRRRLPLTEALVAGAIFGAWLLFAQLYFGGPLPNTYAAKAADVGFAQYAIGALEMQGRNLPRPLHRLDPPLQLWPSLWKQAVFLLALPLLWRTGAALAGLPALLRRGDPAGGPSALPARGGLDLAPLAFGALLLWLGYSFIGPPLGHQWYLIPVTYCLLALGLAAWSALLRPLLRRLPPALPVAATLLVVVAALAVLPWGVRRETALMTSPAFGADRIAAYEEMARWSRRHGLADTTLLTHEPGYITYLSGQRAIDAAGLVTPNVFYHGPSARRSDHYELMEKTRPELAVLRSPVMHEPGIRERRYQLALSAVPSPNLWIRRDVFRQHLASLYGAWQRGDYYQGPPARFRHPFAIDFGEGGPAPFENRNADATPVEGLFFGGRATGSEKLFNTQGRRGVSVLWSWPFAIDFDELDFLFAANHDFLTAAQVYVDGLLVYEVVGRKPPEGPARSGPLERIEVPLYPWRGRTGKLYFVSAEGDKGFLATDRIESKIYSRRRPFDDFESGAYAPGIWEKGFTAAPVDTRAIAAEAGLPAVQGRFAAASLFVPGPQAMLSHAFLIDHAYLSFTIADWGTNTRVELRVAGQRKHLYTGHGRGQVDLVKWDLRALAGREAVLGIYDETPEAEKGIAIDSILLHDD